MWKRTTKGRGVGRRVVSLGLPRRDLAAVTTAAAAAALSRSPQGRRPNLHQRQPNALPALNLYTGDETKTKGRGVVVRAKAKVAWGTELLAATITQFRGSSKRRQPLQEDHSRESEDWCQLSCISAAHQLQSRAGVVPSTDSELRKGSGTSSAPTAPIQSPSSVKPAAQALRILLVAADSLHESELVEVSHKEQVFKQFGARVLRPRTRGGFIGHGYSRSTSIGMVHRLSFPVPQRGHGDILKHLDTANSVFCSFRKNM